MLRIGFIASGCLAIFLLAGCASSPEQLGRIDSKRVEYIEATLCDRPAGLAESVGNRAFWENIVGKDVQDAVVENARAQLAESMPVLTDELYLDYSKTGSRESFQEAWRKRDWPVYNMVLAECFENRGHFLGRIEQWVHAVCADRTWCLPAHDRKLDAFYGRDYFLDLRVAMTALSLAHLDYLLGERLAPQTRILLRENLEQRVFHCDSFRVFWRSDQRTTSRHMPMNSSFVSDPLGPVHVLVQNLGVVDSVLAA